MSEPSPPPGVPDEEAPLLSARYRALVEQLPAVIYVNLPDEATTTIFVSPQTEAILGIGQEAWFNGEWSDRVHPDDVDGVDERYHRMLREGDGGADQYRFLRGDGQEIWIHDRITVLRDEHGTPTLVQGMMFDVTEQRRAEEVLQRQASVMAKVDAIARRFDEQLLRGTRLRQVLDTLAEIVANPIVFEDPAHQLIEYSPGELGERGLLAAWERHSRLEHPLGDSATDEVSGDPACIWLPVRVRDQEWGRIHILGTSSPFDELDRLALDRARASVGLSLLLERDREQLADRARSELLSDVWQGRWRSARDLVDRMRSLGTAFGDADVWLTALVIELPGLTVDDDAHSPYAQPAPRRRAVERLLTATRGALAQTGTPGICATVSELCLAVLADGGPERLQAIADDIVARCAEDLPGMEVVVGASRPARPDQLGSALTEASQAASDGARLTRRSGLHRAEDLGLRQLLARLGDGPELSRFVEAELGPVLASPAAAEHLATLRALMDAGGHKSRAAKALFVERRTLYYRLDRIAALLQRSFENPADRLRLEVALHGLDVLRSRRG